MITTNKVNTGYTDEMLEALTKEEKETFLEYIFSIEFIKNLISPDREYARDQIRYLDPYVDDPIRDDKYGKINVNLANPHILENMDYFRASAISYETHGRYTLTMPSKNPYSDYVKFWDEEIKRCWHGMVRPEDGEWITGYHYFYLNYSPILRSKIKEGSKKAARAYGFPDFYDGDYWFFHYIEKAREHGQHTCTLKKRGAGYSFKAGSKLARNFILGESEEANKEVASFAIANEKEYLTKDGVLNKFVSILGFCGDNTPFPRRKELKNQWSQMHWIMGYKDPHTDLEKGTKNEVMGITLKNDPERARGKRGALIEWEEFGKFSNSLKAWNIGRPSTEEDGFAFGLMNAYGTGGTEGASFKGLRELFYNPIGYNVHSLQNVYDKNAKPGSTCAFFHGMYLNAKDMMDENGNSDVTATLLNIIRNRIKIKYNSRDSQTLVQNIAEKPITPQEAIMKVGGSIFPTVDIRDYLEEARSNESAFIATNIVGDLMLLSETEVKFEVNHNKKPIRRYEPDVANVEGALEIFRMPEKNERTGIVPSYRYIGGIDPVDNDYIISGSLASIFIFDCWTDQIVAEYTGRPQLAEDFYELCRRLLLFYNAQANYENNIKGLFGYFNNKNCLYLLCDTPKYLSDIEEIKTNLFGNRSKGTRTTKGVIAEGKRLQKSWMLEPYTYQEDEEEKETIILRTIKSIGYLEEAYQYNDDGNFDRISAMDMVMILRQDRLKITETKGLEDEYIEEDEFIKNNFDNVFNKENKSINLYKKMI